MKLTALEIKQQTFDKSIRGFDVAEVQAFLNLVSNEWEHLVSKNEELNREIGKLNEKLRHYERVEEALHETLQTARESVEQKLEGTEKETRIMLEKAEMQANMIVREAHEERQQIRQNILRLLDRRNEIIGGIRSYLQNAQESLNQFSKDETNLYALPPQAEDTKRDSSGETGETGVETGGKKERNARGGFDSGEIAGEATGKADAARSTGKTSDGVSDGVKEKTDRREEKSSSISDEVDDILDEID